MTMTATLEAPPPVSSNDLVRCTIADPTGVVAGTRHLPAGSQQHLPRDLYAALAAEGRVHAIVPGRYVVLTTTLIGSRLHHRSPEVVEIDEALPDVFIKAGYAIRLEPGQSPPVPLPPDPMDSVYWTKGPRVRVEVLKPTRVLPGFGISPVGTILEPREYLAVHHIHHGHVRALDELTPLGKQVLAVLNRGESMASYEAAARACSRGPREGLRRSDRRGDRARGRRVRRPAAHSRPAIPHGRARGSDPHRQGTPGSAGQAVASPGAVPQVGGPVLRHPGRRHQDVPGLLTRPDPTRPRGRASTPVPDERMKIDEHCFREGPWSVFQGRPPARQRRLRGLDERSRRGRVRGEAGHGRLPPRARTRRAGDPPARHAPTAPRCRTYRSASPCRRQPRSKPRSSSAPTSPRSSRVPNARRRDLSAPA